MTLLIFIFASLILLAGLMLLANPKPILGFLRKNTENSAIHLIAIVARLTVGVALILQSSLSRFPSAIELLGWALVVAGISLAVIGRNNFRKLMSWVLIKFEPFGRLAGIVAIAFGGFLVYAFL